MISETAGDMLLRQFHICFKLDVGFADVIVEKTPAGSFEELVYFYAGFCFFGHNTLN